MSGVTSGLYMLRLIGDSGESIGSPAAILVVPAGDTEALQKWAEVKRRSAQWNEADPTTIQNVMLELCSALQNVQANGH